MWAIRGSFLLGWALLCGEVIVVDSPKEITNEWEARVLGIRYGVTDLANAVQEMTEGFIDDYFGKEFIEKIREGIKKDPTGEYVEYWENGNLKVKLPYKDGKPNGHIHGWYDNGRDAFKGFFNQGVKQGIHITFYRTEEKEHAKKARHFIYNEQGYLDGDQRRNYPNGNLWISVEFINGKANGPLECWDNNQKQKQIMSVDYKKGILQKNPPPPPPERKRPKLSRAEQYVNELIRDFEKIVGKEFGIKASGSGAGMPYDVERIEVNFSVYKKGTIEEARELMVNLKERLAEVVNQNEKLRPYLREYPFSPLRANIHLRFYGNKGRSCTDGSIAFVGVGREKNVYYSVENPKNHQLDDVFEEPYEEAVKIVKTKQKGGGV